MVRYLHYYRSQRAIQNLQDQRKEIFNSISFFAEWKPMLLSLLREYLGEEDDIYVAVSNLEFLAYDPRKITIDEYEHYVLFTKSSISKHIDSAISRIQQGKLQPHKYNFFARIPLPNAIAIYIALLITPMIFAYSMGKENGKMDCRNQMESQSSQLTTLKQENNNLYITIGDLNDSLAEYISKIKLQ